jgi:hypothetical protein
MIKANLNLGNGITVSIENANAVNDAGSSQGIVSAEWMPAVEMTRAIDGLKKISNECMYSAEHLLAIYSTEGVNIREAAGKVKAWILEKLRQLGELLQKVFAKAVAFISSPIHKKAEDIVNRGFNTDNTNSKNLAEFISKFNSNSAAITTNSMAININTKSEFKTVISKLIQVGNITSDAYAGGQKNLDTANGLLSTFVDTIDKYKQPQENAKMDDQGKFINGWKNVNTAFQFINENLKKCEDARKKQLQYAKSVKDENNEAVKILRGSVTILGTVINKLVASNILQGMPRFDIAIIKANAIAHGKENTGDNKGVPTFKPKEKTKKEKKSA